MVKTLKEVRIQPGPYVRFEQSENIERLCVKKSESNLSTGRKLVQSLVKEA